MIYLNVLSNYLYINRIEEIKQNIDFQALLTKLFDWNRFYFKSFEQNFKSFDY